MEHQKRAKNATVLIVEDDPLIRETLDEILSGEGYHTVSARDGAEALTRLRETGSTDLIILDLMMPVMNGWEFRAEQLRDASISKIPVIVVTGSTHSAERSAGLKSLELLAKPLNLELLLQTVARYC